jgi:UTP--glucose-1-phosphate uridylyltransferase
MARMIGRAPFHGLRFAGRRFDCGGKLGYLEAMIACALEREDLRDGVREMLRRYR